MFCSNCGNPLSSTDKFCSNCGTPVEREEKPEDTMFKSEEPGNLQEENEEIKLEPPSEKFDWNVHTFPGTEPHPTEDINFDWHMGDDDFQREPKGEEIAFAPEPPKVRSTETRLEGFDAPTFLKKEEPVVKEEPELPAVPAEPEAPNVPEKPEAPKEPETPEPAPPMEERKAEFAAPIFVGVGPKLEAAPKQEEAPQEEIEEYTGWTFEDQAPPQENVVGPKLWTPSAPVIEPMPDPEEEKVIQGEELERELFENIEAPSNPTLARQTAKIDKFYTFNKKNEEFQKLLDQEYEKFKGDRGEQGETFGSDVETLRQDLDSREEEVHEIYGTSQVEEMAKARELFFAEDIDPEDLGSAEKVEKPKEPEEIKPEEAEPIAVAVAPPVETPKKEKPEPQEEQTEDEKNVEAFWKEGEQAGEEVATKEKSGKAGTIAIVILSVILAALIILLAIRFFAPESAASKKMDEITNNVFTIFQGGDNTATASDGDNAVPMEDKTGLIQLELDKNQDGVIETIRYNASLAWDENATYEDRDITASEKLTDNKWYTDADGKEHFYDRSLVGTIIAYVSKTAADNNEGDALKTLDIGEFREGKNGYYVWAAEYKATEGQADTVERKIYKVTVNRETMEVEDSYSL